MYLLNDETGQTNKLKDIYIMEPLKLKQLQLYINAVELEYRSDERKKHRHQLSNTLQLTIEGVSETLETADVDTTAS